MWLDRVDGTDRAEEKSPEWLKRPASHTAGGVPGTIRGSGTVVC